MFTSNRIIKINSYFTIIKNLNFSIAQKLLRHAAFTF